jgi:hypothetical protein
MSVFRSSILFVIFLVTSVISAQAASNERVLSGNLAVWIFLGLCALIIVAQVAPMLWQINKRSRQLADQTAASKQPQVH